MRIGFFLILGLSFGSTASYSFSKKMDQVAKEDKKIIDQIKLEKGGQIMLEQLLVKKDKYNLKDPYKLELYCEASTEGKMPDCKIVKYEVLKKPLR